jgi:hypothetical protein
VDNIAGLPTNSDDAKENGSEGSNVEDGSDHIHERRKGKEATNADDDGDYDSLASDASTGPAQVKVLDGKEEKHHPTNDAAAMNMVRMTEMRYLPSSQPSAAKRWAR